MPTDYHPRFFPTEAAACASFHYDQVSAIEYVSFEVSPSHIAVIFFSFPFFYAGRNRRHALNQVKDSVQHC